MPVLFKSVVALSVVLCMLGCAKKEAATTSEASSSTVASTTVAATQATVPAPASPAPASTMSVPPAGSVPPASPTAGAIATAEGENPALRVDVTELKRSSGGALSLKFIVHNNSDKAVSYRSHFLGEESIRSDYASIGAVHIIDPVGKKKYFVTRDTDEKCVCSTDLEDVKPGSQTNLWAKFPAPPPEVKAVTVVIPHFTPMDDVPIQ